MTEAWPPVPPDPQLGAADIRRLFDALSSHLRDAGSAGHHLMIAGGAALALMWEDRTTHEADAAGAAHGDYAVFKIGRQPLRYSMPA